MCVVNSSVFYAPVGMLCFGSISLVFTNFLLTVGCILFPACLKCHCKSFAIKICIHTCSYTNIHTHMHTWSLLYTYTAYTCISKAFLLSFLSRKLLLTAFDSLYIYFSLHSLLPLFTHLRDFICWKIAIIVHIYLGLYIYKLVSSMSRCCVSVVVVPVLARLNNVTVSCNQFNCN